MRIELSGPSERSQYRVELQARTVEALLARHGVDADVRGGAANPRRRTFVVEAPQGVSDLHLPTIERQMQATLRAMSVHLYSNRGGFHVEVDDGPGPRVNLLDLLADCGPWPPGVVALGQAEDGRPLYLNLFAPHASHVLLVGRPASGKRSLLRSIALSLAMTHRQADVQMAFVDGSGGAFHALHYLPHAIHNVAGEIGEIVDLLRFLEGEIAYRRDRGIVQPAIVTFVDGFSRLLAVGDAPLQAVIGRLLRRGPAAGLRLILSARDVPSREMSHALRAHAPTRIVGSVADTRAALAASGVPDSGAEYLLDHGDFVAIAGASRIRFQAAGVDDYDLHLCLEKLQRWRPPPLLARPFDVRPRFLPAEQPAHGPSRFSFDGERLTSWE